MERRKFERVGCRTEALITHDGKTFEGEVENLSLKGLFVKTDHKIGIGESVDITVLFHGMSADMSFSIRAKVVRIAEDGIGFNFRKIDVDSLACTNADPEEQKRTGDLIVGKFGSHTKALPH